MNIYQNAADEPVFIDIVNPGEGYAVGDTMVFLDPNDDSNEPYATLTVGTINPVGLSLYDGSWVSTTAQSNYISEVDVNYVDNGDFADNSPSDTTDNSGNDIAWTQVGATTLLECSTLDANGYDGDDGTCNELNRRHECYFWS